MMLLKDFLKKQFTYNFLKKSLIYFYVTPMYTYISEGNGALNNKITLEFNSI